MILRLQDFKHLLINLLDLYLVILEIFPKYGNIILSSNFRTVVKTGFWKNILLTNFALHLSTNFVWEVSLWSVFLSVPTSKCNLEKLYTLGKLPCKSLYTKPNTCSSAVNVLKLAYTPLNVSFLKTLVLNLSFSLQILTSRKEKFYPFQFQTKI